MRMSYPTMMAYVEADQNPEQRVRIATTLAEKFDAALIGLSATPIPAPAVADDVVTLIPTEDDIKLMEAKLAAAGNWFRRIAGEHRKVEWRQFLESPVDVLPREARTADLVIIGRTRRRFGEYGCL